MIDETPNTANVVGTEEENPAPAPRRIAGYLIPLAAIATVLLNVAVLRSAVEPPAKVVSPVDRLFTRTHLILETLASGESVRADLSGADLHEVIVLLNDPLLFEDIEELALAHPDNFVLANLQATHERVGRIFRLTFEAWRERAEGAIGWPEPVLGAHEVHSILRLCDLCRRTRRCLEYLTTPISP